MSLLYLVQQLQEPYSLPSHLLPNAINIVRPYNPFAAEAITMYALRGRYSMSLYNTTHTTKQEKQADDPPLLLPSASLERRNSHSNNLRITVRDADGRVLDAGIARCGLGCAVELREI